MGCDIHLYAEMKVDGKWQNIDKWTKNPCFDKDDDFTDAEWEVYSNDKFYTGGRNYNLFSALAGVRSNHFIDPAAPISEPKGVPNDADERTLYDYERYGTDAHSASFLTLAELKQYDWSPFGTTCDSFRSEVIPKMEAFGGGDEEIRIVFFFDN